ncbi:MAG: zinc/manganese transporter permease, partial [Gammaproteobacteria bacterium]|nr:zinc/manganese transporter permease [Gammaproteobacteria bacterium]
MLLNSLFWLAPWLAGVLVTLTHIPLGQQVLQRGIIFLDLAIAQAAGLGVIVGILLGYQQPLMIQLIAAFSASLMALILHGLEKRHTEHLEAWIGCGFVITACIGLGALSISPHAAEHLQSILTGQLLWVAPKQLTMTLGFYGLAGLVYWFFPRSFYCMFALCITATVQLVGVYLVFATLIMPALAVSTLKPGVIKLFSGYGFSILAYTLGMIVSYYWDIPTSPL